MNFLLCIFLCFFLFATSEQIEENRAKLINSINNAVNFSVDPCDDFYSFACGKWLSQNTIPDDDDSISSFSTIKNEIVKKMQKVLESDEPVPNVLKKAKDFYRQCMNEPSTGAAMFKAIKRLGRFPATSPIPDFDFTDLLIKCYPRISDIFFGMVNFADWAENSTELDKHIQIYNGDLKFETEGILERLLDSNSSFIDDYEEYLVKKISILSSHLATDVSEMDAKKAALDISNFITSLALILKSHTNKTTADFSKFQSLFPVVNWTRYLEIVPPAMATYLKSGKNVEIFNSENFAKIETLLRNTTNQTIFNYMAIILSESFTFSYDSDTERITQKLWSNMRKKEIKRGERWRRCVKLTDQLYPLLTGTLYVRNELNTREKTEVANLAVNIKNGMKDVIATTTWMDEQTKKNALRKLDYMIVIISHIELLTSDAELEKFHKDLKIANDFQDSIVDQIHWKLTLKSSNLERTQAEQNSRFSSYQVDVPNALAAQDYNSIYIFSGIISSPFYDISMPNALNYGGIGFAIAHEIMHHFDPNGIRRNHLGQKLAWLSEDAARHFNSTVACLIEQYSNETTDFKQNLNGERTITENVADNGGLKVAFQAYRKYRSTFGPEKKLHPFLDNDQLFFLGFARTFCDKESLFVRERRLASNSHTMSPYRAEIPLRNSIEFAQAFNCPLGSRENPIDKCTVW